MRLALAACLALSSVGCANTIQRLDGEIPLATGPARSACEKAEWLVMAPTSYEVVRESGRSDTQLDGAALYPVGGSEASDLPELGPRIDPDAEVFLRKAGEVSQHDRDRTIGLILAGVGVAAVATGTYLFVTSFDETTDASGDAEQTIDGTKAVAGGLTVGSGFIIGIIGLVVSPNHAERAEADAARYVFNPSQDDPERVKALIDRHNARIRQRCEAAGQGAGAADVPAAAAPTSEGAAPWLRDAPKPAPAATPEGADE